MDKKIGIVICTYNRPDYLRQCLESIKRADNTYGILPIVISDDCSTDKETVLIIEEFAGRGLDVHPIRTAQNSGISRSLKNGIDKLHSMGVDIVINLDSDALVRNDFVEQIMKRQRNFSEQIVTGFNCLTRNADGSERHAVIEELNVPVYSVDGNMQTQVDEYKINLKKSVGGINMCFNCEVYRKYIEPALNDVIANKGNWDHKACINSEKDGKSVVCCVPSVVQHIGFDSSMNHREEPDTAADFKPLRLKGVELICVDCLNLDRAMHAVNKSTEFIEFDKVTVLSSIPSGDPRVTRIGQIKTKEQYSDFMVRSLHTYMTSTHSLIVQYDGYVMNWQAWDSRWLQYDYIGAPWWYKDGMNVGNGGFSLRSKKLHFIIANDRSVVKTHPEDDVICRQYRKHLEQYGLTWAPEEMARQFSIEGHGKGNDRHYNGQFGYHGTIVKFHEDVESKDVIILNQFFGLGDILFCIPMARDFIAKGHKVLWPVEPHYVNINKHFPEITFVDKSLLNINYELKEDRLGNGFQVLPIRWTHAMRGVGMDQCMKVKYEHLGMDWKKWRELTWQRDEKAEDILFKKLGLKDGDRYCLVNQFFQSDNRGNCKITPPTGMKVITMSSMEGFTLLDWAKVIENATEIHTVSTSIIYMLEVMDKVTQPVHLYIRRPNEKDHSYYNYLLEKKNYIYMP